MKKVTKKILNNKKMAALLADGWIYGNSWRSESGSMIYVFGKRDRFARYIEKLDLVVF